MQHTTARCRLRNMTALLTGLALALSLLAGCVQRATALEANTPVRITGCYSNLSLHEESGDILGREFFIVYSGDGHHVLYQESEGWPTVLLLLPVTVAGNTIRFAIPRGNNRQCTAFEGTVTQDGLSGTFSNGERVVLKRKASFWQ